MWLKGSKGAASPESSFSWRVAKGTMDLQATAYFQQPQGETTLVEGPGLELRVLCSDTGKVLIGSSDGLLNANVRSGDPELGGATWTWTGDPLKADAERYFVDGFTINGSLHCDAEILVANIGQFTLRGVLVYQWKGISPCPPTLPGCTPCPRSDAVCRDQQQAICDGGAKWKCVSAAQAAAVSQAAADAARTHAPPTPMLARTTTSPAPKRTFLADGEKKVVGSAVQPSGAPAMTSFALPKHTFLADGENNKQSGSLVQPSAGSVMTSPAPLGFAVQHPATPVDNNALSLGSVIATMFFLFASIAVGATAGCVVLHIYGKPRSVAPKTSRGSPSSRSGRSPGRGLLA